MKVGDLVKFKYKTSVRGNLFLVMRTQCTVTGSTPDQRVWIYPDPDADEGYDHTDDDNYYHGHLLEVISESR